MRTPECSVVIPVCNKWKLTRDCLVSLGETSREHNLEVIVVDNGSTDETATMLLPLGKHLFGDRFSTLIFPENRNFGPACNAGAKTASAPLLFFLNNDTVLTPGWAGPLLRTLNGEDAPGAASPLLLYENNTVQHLGVAFNVLRPAHLYRHFPRNHRVVSYRRTLMALSGAALMLPAALFWQCGGFYEEYRNGYEDLELSVGIRKQGKKLVCVPQSVVYHLEGQTPGRMLDEKSNSALFFKRCGEHVHIDYHKHACRDGYGVILNDLLTLSLCGESEEKKLTEEARNKEIPEILRMIEANPLWISGCERLAEHFEITYNWEYAASLRARLADIQPLEQRYTELLRLEPHVRDTSFMEKAKQFLRIIQEFKSDAAYTRHRLHTFRKHFKRPHDTFLESLFAAKYKEMFSDGRGGKP